MSHATGAANRSVVAHREHAVGDRERAACDIDGASGIYRTADDKIGGEHTCAARNRLRALVNLCLAGDRDCAAVVDEAAGGIGDEQAVGVKDAGRDGQGAVADFGLGIVRGIGHIE